MTPRQELRKLCGTTDNGQSRKDFAKRKDLVCRAEFVSISRSPERNRFTDFSSLPVSMRALWIANGDFLDNSLFGKKIGRKINSLIFHRCSERDQGRKGPVSEWQNSVEHQGYVQSPGGNTALRKGYVHWPGGRTLHRHRYIRCLCCKNLSSVRDMTSGLEAEMCPTLRVCPVSGWKKSFYHQEFSLELCYKGHVQWPGDGMSCVWGMSSGLEVELCTASGECLCPVSEWHNSFHRQGYEQ
ncbi:hypothetical protein TNCV_2757991 [Trichonephila clavipes]|nr:hypothetical protein TNCV_2757991 [Trichonephila clavipes]